MFPCIFCCFADICFWCMRKKSFSVEACDWTWSRGLSSVHYWLRQSLEITTITQPTTATPRSTVKTPAMTPSTSKNTGKSIFSVRITSVLPPNNIKVILPLNAAERKWLRQWCVFKVLYLDISHWRVLVRLQQNIKPCSWFPPSTTMASSGTPRVTLRDRSCSSVLEQRACLSARQISPLSKGAYIWQEKQEILLNTRSFRDLK